MSTWQALITQSRERYLEDLQTLLRIPSVSADPAHARDVWRAAEFVAGRLRAAGLENVAIDPAGRHACVYADWTHAPAKPTVLIYGHFDVQPADPVELWDSGPFEPAIKDGRIYARGACDMKANLLLTIQAVEALLQADDTLPLNVKFLFEGQEEIGSRDLPAYVAAHRERLACDVVVTPDGGQWSENQPNLCLGTKGLCALEVDVRTAALDLHSGVYGGAVPNANHALVQLLSSLRDESGNILVEGFYDSVRPLTPEERAAFDDVPFDAGAYQQELGVDALVGEPGYSTYERAWARPTVEINGIWGGYQGEGTKTVIPCEAHAKITCRLVPNQEPEIIRNLVARHMERHAPPGARVTVTPHAGLARPYLMPADHPANRAAAQVLQQIYGVAPVLVRSGGTLPIMDLFLRELGAHTIDMGFALDDERMHSPNEFFRLADYDRGRQAYCMLLSELATAGLPPAHPQRG